ADQAGRRGTLRTRGANGIIELTTPQKLMVFVLSMSLFGLSNIMLELIPDIQVGPVDISISNMIFIPLTMAVLFSPFWAALGAPLGEIVFTDLLMGDFSGLAEVEGYLQMFLGIYIGGSLVRRVTSVPQIWIGAIVIIGIDKLLSAVVDLSKVWIGVEDAEYVSGLPESILVVEGVGFVTDLVTSGILFGAIPAMWIIPRLHGRIEPLMGIRPRQPGERPPGQARGNAAFVAVAVLLSVASFGFAFLEAFDVSAGEWSPDFLGEYGNGVLWVSVAAVAVVLALAVLLFRVSQKKSGKKGGTQ
ncbi:hypothetical protein, partial [Corynebacterium sp.]